MEKPLYMPGITALKLGQVILPRNDFSFNDAMRLRYAGEFKNISPWFRAVAKTAEFEITEINAEQQWVKVRSNAIDPHPELKIAGDELCIKFYTQ